ncbi:MAG: translation initiation factor Sui1 [Proteobacteria bacterium]|nr:translation initiation factor Sui1 [Pseudomonadota bacterium]
MKKHSDNNIRTVYSSELGRLCPGCGQAVDRCRCGDKKTPATSRDGLVRLNREVSGRGGKAVTVITGLPLEDKALRDLSKKMKKRCGTGGTVKNGNIEIQGEHGELLMAELSKLGYRVKLAGGYN